jgi:hypothetical protein
MESNSWSAEDGGSWPFKLHKYNWSNNEDWIAARAQDCSSNTCGVWAIHTGSGKLVRMTFSSEEHTDPNLFVGNPATSVPVRPVSHVPLRIHRAVPGFALFDLRGLRGSTHDAATPLVRIDTRAGATVLLWEKRR